MQKEDGDDYVRRTADFIRTNSQALAGGNPARRGTQATQTASFFGWMSRPEAPMSYSTDLHHIFYLLMRFEELGVPVGPLDVRLPMDSISRPLSYVSLLAAKDKSETGSVFSFKSISGVSKMSLGAGWWPRAPVPSVDEDLKFIYSAFTKLPALTINQSSLDVITQLANDPPVDHVVPLYTFKTIRTLECIDIDPRLIMGWDQLAESLRSLTLRRSGIEDLTEVFVDVVLEDQARKNGDSVKPRRRKLIHRTIDSRRPSWKGPPPTTPPIQEEGPEPEPIADQTESSPSSPPPQLSSLKWAFLKHLSLADNGLTFFPANIIPYLLSVTYLDLSSNLLVSVPSGLNQMYNLVTLNLADNMIESVLGIYTMLGQVLTLNLSRNRIDSLCGLERLAALERVDVRKNEVLDIEEVGRLATLPNLQGVWIDGNPFTESDPNYRITCFNMFLKEGKSITLDGTQPSFLERRSLITPATPTPVVPSGIKSPDVAPSPPAVNVGSSPSALLAMDSKVEETTAVTPPVQTAVRKKRPTKRLVDLDGTVTIGNEPGGPKRGHRRGQSEAIASPQAISPSIKISESSNTGTSVSPRRSAHARGMSAYSPSTSPPPRPVKARSPTAAPAPISGYATISGNGTMSRRRTALSSTMFSPTAEEPSSPSNSVSKRSDGRASPGSPNLHSADAFRAEIEALRASAPDNWLKVLSQKQFSISQDVRDGAGPRVGSPGADADGARRRRHLRGATEF
jgi:Leucine-rich repeat (LRR) protein